VKRLSVFEKQFDLFEKELILFKVYGYFCFLLIFFGWNIPLAPFIRGRKCSGKRLRDYA